MVTKESLLFSALIIIYLCVSAYVTVMFNLYFKKREVEKNKKPSKQTKAFLNSQKKSYKQPITYGSVRNSKVLNEKPSVKNDVSEYQKIKTSETVLPVIKATVLEYAPGELGEVFSEPTKLYYSPECISDKEFLESVIRSPWNTKTHELNTGEGNLKVCGWGVTSWFDEKDKTTYTKGYLIGEENIDYAKENKDTPSFGTSAFISFLKIDKESGTTPEGLEYNAIARKAVCNHIAILPNIRDEKNKIVSINAKNALIESNNKKIITGVKNTMEQEEFNALMEKYNEQKNAKNEEMDKIVNAVLEKLNSKNGEGEKKPDAPNADEKPVEEKKPDAPNADEKPVEEKKPDAPNADHKEPDGDEAKAANALPSEKLVGVFAEHYGLRFSKTPTVKQLAEIAEIPYTSFSQALNALKKKSEEILGSVTSVKNSDETNQIKSVNDAIKRF